MYKLLYDEVSYEITDRLLGVPTGGDPPNVADIPPTFEWDSRILWKYNTGSGEVEMKTGQELADAQAVLNARIADAVIKKHAGKLIDPTTQGKMEEAADLLVQAMNHFMNGTAPTQTEVDNWNAFYSTNEPYFSILLTTITQDDINDMKAKKQEARNVKNDIENDPDWPYGA